MKPHTLFSIVIAFIGFQNLNAQNISSFFINQNEVFVNINNNHRPSEVKIFSPSGEEIGHIETEEEHVNLIAANDEHVFVNINNNHRPTVIKGYNRNGEILSRWEIEGQVTSLSVGDDSIFVNINNNHRILRYSFEGEYLGSLLVD